MSQSSSVYFLSRMQYRSNLARVCLGGLRNPFRYLPRVSRTHIRFSSECNFPLFESCCLWPNFKLEFIPSVDSPSLDLISERLACTSLRVCKNFQVSSVRTRFPATCKRSGLPLVCVHPMDTENEELLCFKMVEMDRYLLQPFVFDKCLGVHHFFVSFHGRGPAKLGSGGDWGRVPGMTLNCSHVRESMSVDPSGSCVLQEDSIFSTRQCFTARSSLCVHRKHSSESDEKWTGLHQQRRVE